MTFPQPTNSIFGQSMSQEFFKNTSLNITKAASVAAQPQPTVEKPTAQTATTQAKPTVVESALSSAQPSQPSTQLKQLFGLQPSKTTQSVDSQAQVG